MSMPERKEKTIKIGGKKATFFEITGGIIEEMYQTEAGIQILSNFYRGDHEHIPFIMKKLSNLSLEEIRALRVKDYKLAVDTLREVNTDFFAIWGEELERMRKAAPKTAEESPSPT